MTQLMTRRKGRALWARTGWALWLVTLAALSALATACGDDGDGGGQATTADTQGGDAPDSATEEIISIGDDLSGGEDAASGGADPIIAAAWPFNPGASAGAVTVSQSGGVFSAQIDASAGGLNAARRQAFVYLDLDAGEKLPIDDFEAASNRAWDLAFKRSVIRSNGADGGPGNIRVARITDTSFEAVTSAASDLIFAQDVSLDADKNLITDPLGQPKTAFNYINLDTSSGSWYDYSGGGVMVIAGHIYIIQDAVTGVSFKLEIQGWSNGVYTLRWAKL